VMLSDTWLP